VIQRLSQQTLKSPLVALERERAAAQESLFSLLSSLVFFVSFLSSSVVPFLSLALACDQTLRRWNVVGNSCGVLCSSADGYKSFGHR
jgi:hypothetical protein